MSTLPDLQCLDKVPHAAHDWASLAHRWYCDGVAAQAVEPTPDDETLRLRAQVAAVGALAGKWWERATEATSEKASWRRCARDLRAALRTPPQAPDSSDVERIADVLHETGICGRQGGACYGACGKAAEMVAAALRGAR